jgi:hypothetical protein
LVAHDYEPFLAIRQDEWSKNHINWDVSNYRDLYNVYQDVERPKDEFVFLSKTKILFLGRFLLADLEQREVHEEDFVPGPESSISWISCFGDAFYQYSEGLYEISAKQGGEHGRLKMFHKLREGGDLLGALDFSNEPYNILRFPTYAKTTSGLLCYKIGKLIVEHNNNSGQYPVIHDSIIFFFNVNNQCRSSCVAWVLCAKRIPGLCKDLRKEIAKLVWATRATDPDCWYGTTGNVKKNKI